MNIIDEIILNIWLIYYYNITIKIIKQTIIFNLY